MTDQNDKKNAKYVFKILIVGDSHVGKTNFVNRLVYNEFVLGSPVTIGIEFAKTTYEKDGFTYEIEQWDTAGQEKHNSLTAGFYRNCIGVIFMYDMTQLNSLNHLKDWYKRVKYGTDTRFVSVIVGNKHDLGELCAVKEIDKKHISRYIDESEVIEVSCQSNYNVKKAYNVLIENILDMIKEQLPDFPFIDSFEEDDSGFENLYGKNENNTKSGCCGGGQFNKGKKNNKAKTINILEELKKSEQVKKAANTEENKVLETKKQK